MKNPHFNPAKKHHRPGGFQNNYMSFRGKRWHELLRWKWRAWRAGHPRPPTEPIAIVAPDLAFIQTNAKAGLAMQPAATWIGHITVLAQIGGLNILTDPVFSDRCSPVQWTGPKRQTPAGLSLAQLPHVDVVLLSHNHYTTTWTRPRCWPWRARQVAAPCSSRRWGTSTGLPGAASTA